MIREERKVGPKGQIVIPRVFRKAKGMYPGSTVVFVEKGVDLVLEKPTTDIVAVMERVAKAGPSIGKLDPHEAYESELEEKWKRIERANRGKK